MDPSEHACATVGKRGFICAVLAKRAREEIDANSLLLQRCNNIILPVPAWRVDFEGAEEDVAVGVFELSFMVGVKACDVDDLRYIEKGGGVNGQEELETQVGGIVVHDVKVRGENGSIVGVVNGKGVEAGILGQVDVGGIVWTRGLELDHVVGEYHGGGGSTLGQVGVRVRMRVSMMKT